MTLTGIHETKAIGESRVWFPSVFHPNSCAGGIQSHVLEEIKTVRSLFRLLKNREFLNRENMVYLQILLKVAGRMDLVEKVIDFAKSMGDTLYYYPATREPENGYKYVKMHVEGIDFSNSDNMYIQDLKQRLSMALFVPMQFILLAGIEPSSSLLITFMVPEEYIELMVKRLTNGDRFPELHSHHIDVIKNGDKAFDITGKVEAQVVVSEQNEKLTSVYQQLDTARQNLGRSELEVVRLSEEIERIQTEDKRIRDEMENMRKQVEANDLQTEQLVNTFQQILQKQERENASGINYQELNNRVHEFKDSLLAVNETNNSKQTLKNIVNKNTELITSWMGVSFIERERGLHLALRQHFLAAKAMEAQLLTYQFLASIELDKIEQELLATVQNLQSKFKVEVVAEQRVQLNETALAILRRISPRLRFKEKNKLMKKYIWDEVDKIKEKMDLEPSFFLAGLFYKEMRTKQIVPPYEEFISGLLAEVGRDDLRTKFIDLWRGSHQQRAHSADEPVNMTSTDNEKMWSLMSKMANEVSAMHHRMMSVVGSFPTGIDSPLFDSKYFQNRDASGVGTSPNNSFAESNAHA
ncbi:uncharacterized protein LOC127848420 isoform X2 [Dreissena polymorpha]|uniref:uncharacterized protein LOC127848420 isoform X2 n=1 Tax=Dreissena polymorpha TaxID=45954 RepID=UPI0022646D9E|nr:uncharacterized protein LOC127848420 isoform X2 [Dreissena polymorpha]